MPSTYTTNLGIEKPGDGEQSGLWGNTANANYDILDRAINGSVSISISGTSSSLTTSNGTLSNGQFNVIIFTGSPSGTHTVTISPNTAQKTYLIRNTTLQSIVMAQGSGSTVSVPAGTSKIIYTDGAGTLAAVFDITNVMSLTSPAITGGTITGLAAPLAVNSGGTGSANASDARTALGLTIGTNVQAFSANLTSIAALTATANTFIVGDGTNWVAQSGATARTSLGLGSMATQNSGSVSITGGSITGITPIAIAAGGTGAGTASDARANLGLGGMATQNPGTVAITGGTINGTAIGGTTPAAGAFSSLLVDVSSTTDALRITQRGTGNVAVFEDAANPDATPTVIDANGRVIVGHTASVLSVATTTAYNSTQTSQLQSLGTQSGPASVSIGLWNSVSNAKPTVSLVRSISSSIGVRSSVATGNALGSVDFSGDDGTADVAGAAIIARVDAEPATGSMPSRLQFHTSATGSGAPTERMRIDSAGNVGIGKTASASYRLDVNGAINGTSYAINGTAITATVNEINFLSGVTSSIQTQLNAKQNAITGGATSIVSADLSASRAVVSDASGKVAVSATTANEVGFLSGVTSAIQTQLDGKQAIITGAASTVTSADLTTSRAVVTDGAGKITASNVTTTEVGYLSGVTSGIQAQISGKQNTITGGATTITSSNLTPSRALASDASGKVAVSSVTAVELGYLSGTTSAIQTQIDAKQATITGAATTIASSNLTSNRALISGGTGKVEISAVSSTELGYVAGVTSGIQTQLNAKANLTGAAFTGNISTTGTLSATGNISSSGSVSGAGLSSTTSITATEQFYGSSPTNNPAIPAFSWANDTDTGMFRPGADTIAFSTGGVERFRINSNGALQIGGGSGGGSNGQVLKTLGSSAQPAWDSSLNAGVEVAATSGTAIGFTGIPSWVRRVTMMLNAVTINASTEFLVQIGDSAYYTTGYEGGRFTQGSSNYTATTGVNLAASGTTPYKVTGFVVWTRIGDGNTWVASFATASPQNGCAGGNVITLTGTLSRIRLTTASGTATFTSGSVNVFWE